MPVNPLVLNELRALFRSGATPSALIRRIAEHHAGEHKLDVTVREYFRDAFHVPLIRVGPAQVRQIADGGEWATLNVTVLPRMIQARREWDATDVSESCWFDAVAISDDSAPAADPERIPELAGSWGRMDDEAKQYIERIIRNARSSNEKLDAVAALAERLQQQVSRPASVRAIGA